MSTDNSLAVAQAALVDALIGGLQQPAGFDAARLRAVMQVLLRKRVHAVTHACPSLEHAVGTRFGSLFAEYVRATPLGGGDTAVAEALHFIQWNQDRDFFPDALRTAAVQMSLQSGAWFVFTWLPTARRFVIGVHLPAMRARVVSLPVW